MFIKQGDKVAVEELLKGMIIQSGNDAAVALAEFVGGSDQNFVHLMNKTAKALGMKTLTLQPLMVFLEKTNIPLLMIWRF